MPPCRIDHITVTTPSLAVGAAFVRNALGISPQTGGEHPRMGTHNLLLRLGDTLFLEVIAANPSAGKLDDQGLSLVKLELFHPEPGRIAKLLQSLVVEAPVSILTGPVSRLVAHIQTPRGLRQLPGDLLP